MRTIVNIGNSGKANPGSVLLFMMLALAVSNFRLLGIYLLLLTGIAFISLKYRQIKFPATACWPLLFACLFFVFVFSWSGAFSTIKIFVVPLIWLVGYNMSEARSMRDIFRVITILAFAMAFHALLNYFYNIRIGTIFSTGRSDDIWSGELSGATGQAMNYAMFTSISFWLIFTQPKRRLRFVSAAVLLCGILHMIQMGNRTSLLLVGISAGLNLLIIFTKRRNARQSGIMLVLLMAVIAVCVVLYMRDAWGLRSYIEGSYLFYRIDRYRKSFFAIIENSRFSHKGEYIRQMPGYLWGGTKLRNEVVGTYAHDLWLDIFDEAGILTLTALLAYTIGAFGRIWKVRKVFDVSEGEATCLISYAVILLAQFFVEPIWQGAPMLFCSFVLVDGMFARFLAGASARMIRSYHTPRG